MPERLYILADIVDTIATISLNVLSFGWILAAILDWLPATVGVLVGLSIAALNIVKFLHSVHNYKERHKNKPKHKE